MCKPRLTLTLQCYLGYLEAANRLTQPDKPWCQPTPLATCIHHGLFSYPSFLLSFFLCLLSPSRIHESKHPPFIVSPRTETFSNTDETHPHFAAVSYRSPWRNTPLLSLRCCCCCYQYRDYRQRMGPD